VALLDEHLKRLRRSAEYFQIPFNERGFRDKIVARLGASSADLARVRVTLDEQGELDITIVGLDTVPWAGQILLSASLTDASDVFLHHKTTNRRLYDTALEAAKRGGFDEVLFMNHQGFVTEGAISNIFLRIDGSIVTPDLASGLLPGVFRQHILDRLPQSQVRPVNRDDLLAADRIWLCNALRGCREVRRVTSEDGEILWSGPDGGPESLNP
jgi:para-aminobenzoate synthetase / 4-amino-4-deoxychorismate lyase